MSGWKFEVDKDVVCRSSRGVWFNYEDPNMPLGQMRLPVHGGTYRVTGIEPNEDRPGAVWLSFAEFDPAAQFDGRNFEPVRTTDISALTALLAPAPKRRVLEGA